MPKKFSQPHRRGAGSGYARKGRIFGNDAIGPLTAKILHTYWDWHKREDWR